MARQAIPTGATIENDEPAVPPTRAPIPQGATVEDDGPQVSQGEAFVRHGAQGLTSNFADEIGGFFKALGPDNKGRPLGNAYRAYRDQWRARDDLAAREHPGTAVAANVVGSVGQAFIPGVGAITRIPGVGGAVAGLGASRADLTQGDVAGAARDTATGGVIDLATGGAAKYLGKALPALGRAAEKRIDKRAVNDLLTGVPAIKVQDPNLARLGGRENIPKVLAREGIDSKLLRGPVDELQAAVDLRQQAQGEKLGSWYKGADELAPTGIPLADIQAAFDKVKAKAKGRGDQKAFAAVDAELAGLKSLYDDGKMTAQELHGKVKAFGERGFATSYLDPSIASQFGRDMHDAAREALQQHVDSVAKKHPGKIGDRAELQALNKQYSELRAVSEIVDAKKTRVDRESLTLPQTFQKYAQTGANAGAIAGALGTAASGDLTWGVLGAAGAAGAAAAPHMARFADNATVKLAAAAQRGGTKLELLQLATTLGIPRTVAAQIIEGQQAGVQAPTE